MESSKVIAMNEEYKAITGEEVYLYASNPKGGTVYVFANAQIRNHGDAEGHMWRMLEAARRGVAHQDIVSRFQIGPDTSRGRSRQGRA